jgi:hypothetical protein
MKKTAIFYFILLSMGYAQFGLIGEYKGTWEGTWFNNTSQTTGPIYIEIYVNETDMSYVTYTDIGGIVFGIGDPPPVTSSGSYSNTGVLSIATTGGPLLGDISINIDTDTGVVSGRAQNFPGGFPTSMSIEGTATPQAIDLVYNLIWTGSGANGTINLVKSTDVTPFLDQLDVEGETSLPESFALKQNYPNPFNPITTIRYDLKEGEFVTLTVYDMLGREIRKLVNEFQDPGHRTVQWDGTNATGRSVSGGVYLYSIQTGEYQETRKMLLIK